jgi:hypothetical protein
MPYHDAAEAAMTYDSPSIILEIADRTGMARGKAPTKVPVVIKNLSGEVVTLEMEHFFHVPGWQDLEGSGVTLSLTPPENDKPINVQGTVTWTGYSHTDHPRLNVGLRLVRPTLATRKLLEEHAVHTPQDIKGLWDQWDEVHGSADGWPDRKIHFAGLTLVIAGLALQLPEPSLLKILGWILWLLGSLAMVGKGIWIIWQQWDSR